MNAAQAFVASQVIAETFETALTILLINSVRIGINDDLLVIPPESRINDAGEYLLGIFCN